MDFAPLRQFHTSRREKVVIATIEKSRMPMVWLDTSVLVDFAKIEKGENVEPTRAKRLTRLRSAVRRAVRAEKLVCPEWDQANEYEAKRLESDIRRIVSDLSCGAHCTPYAGVKDKQIAAGMKAYIDGAETMHIRSNIHFYRDPLEAVQEAKLRHYIVESDMPKPVEWIEKAARDKAATQEAVEKLRLTYTAQSQTFDRQLALERVGESDSMLMMIAHFMKSQNEGRVDFWKCMGVNGFFAHMQMYRSLGGPGAGSFESEFAALYSFMRSPYYWELPIQDVSCRLSADLVVKHFQIRSGDSYDTQHLAMAIPVAHYVVADKAMVDRCERLDIGKKWNTKIYSTRTLDDLSDELEEIT